MKCLTPITNKATGEVFKCGHCDYCLSKRRRDWSLRVDLEDKVSTMTWFATLTYDDEIGTMNWVEWSRPLQQSRMFDAPEYVPVVDKKHVQDFLKRLRWHYHNAMPDAPPLRYLCVSEYGDVGLRPHYHILIFNLNVPADKIDNFLCRIWQHGSVLAKPFTPGGGSYLVKYLYDNPMLPDYAKVVPAYRPFLLSSRRPGIGIPYFTDAIKNFYRRNPQSFITYMGKKYSTPRYFFEVLYDSDMKELVREVQNQFITEKDTAALLHFRTYGDMPAFGTAWDDVMREQRLDSQILRRKRAAYKSRYFDD